MCVCALCLCFISKNNIEIKNKKINAKQSKKETTKYPIKTDVDLKLEKKKKTVKIKKQKKTEEDPGRLSRRGNQAGAKDMTGKQNQ